MLKKLIKIELVVMGIFLIIDSGIHLFNLRLGSVSEVWPISALSFSKFLSQIYGSFVLFAALFLLELARKIETHKNLIFVVGLWTLLHGIFIAYLLATNFYSGFGNYSSLYFYMTPAYYKVVEFIESLFLISFGILIFFWKSKSR